MRESPKESKTLNAVFLLLTSLMRCLFAIHNPLKYMFEILAMHCAICTLTIRYRNAVVGSAIYEHDTVGGK